MAITAHFGVSEFSVLPINDPNMRAMYHFLSTGYLQPDEWYRELTQPESEIDVASFVDTHKENVNTNTDLNEIDENIPAQETSAIDNPVSETSNVTDSEEIENLIHEYKENSKKFDDRLFDDLKNNKDFKKCFKKLTKTLGKLSRSNSETLKSRIYNFCQTESFKKGDTIRVQNTSIARRKTKSRGSGLATYGRRVQDTALRSQLVCDGDRDNVYFSLPKQKGKSNKMVHSLQKAIDENRGHARKH